MECERCGAMFGDRTRLLGLLDVFICRTCQRAWDTSDIAKDLARARFRRDLFLSAAIYQNDRSTIEYLLREYDGWDDVSRRAIQNFLDDLREAKT